MGEVYRATDRNLKRQVAIKVLPEAVAADAERLARFQREAEVLASLNHPNIAIIHGLEKSDRVTGLVMELVEGPTLADRIALGPISIEEAVSIAKQIANALEAAHKHGIIHRDLKPANIKLRSDGTVKVLDFGLAKPREETSSPNIDASASPTVTSPAMMTSAGLILGTAAYMSPEQARGKPTDCRTDIWAFGVVLYEMVTGKRLFDGEDVTDTIAAVVKQQPDLSGVPRTVRKLVEACLKKDPRHRLQAIGDWSLLLAEPEPDAPIQPQSHSRRVVSLAVALALATLTLAALAFVHFREVAEERRVVRLSVPLPHDSQAAYLELSPDGRRLLVVLAGEGPSQIHLRSLDSAELMRLAGTNGARTPFWSPDSHSIAFFADGALKAIPAAGGPAQVLCRETGQGRGGAWSREGIILFATENGRLRQVDAKGGGCRPVGTDDSVFRARFPAFLSDGRHFFYIRQAADDESSLDVYLASFDDYPGRKVLAGTPHVVYAPAPPGGSAHVLLLRERRLIAQRFDDASFQLVGDPFVVAEQGAITFSRQVGASAAADGTLVYLAGRSDESQLVWVDRSGKVLEKVGPRAEQSGVTLSPDGTITTIFRLDENGSQGALWLRDLVRGSETPLTKPGFVGEAVWSPDGRRLWVGMVGSEGPGTYEKDLRSGALELVDRDSAAAPKIGSDWSRDGRFRVYTENDPKTLGDIWYVPLSAGKIVGKPVALLRTPAMESQGQLSPDGKWLAYTSNETGAFEVYIRAFPSGASMWRVSVDGGREPRWRSDGRELFFHNAVGVRRIGVSAVAVVPDGQVGLHIDSSRTLFEVAAFPYSTRQNLFTYSPHPDGQRFLVSMLADTSEQTVNVITNWQKAIDPK
jgi:serine/threonine protein kinase